MANQTGTQGNLSASPLFRNQAAGDYRLSAGSPAIDTGTSLGAPSTDFDGVTRPLDGNGDGTTAIDIGAFEAPTAATREVVVGPPAGICTSRRSAST